MKVTLIVGQNCDSLITHDLKIDGQDKWNIYPLEPEDAIIGRDLIDGTDLIKAIKLGYDAALRGEKLEIEYEDAEEE